MISIMQICVEIVCFTIVVFYVMLMAYAVVLYLLDFLKAAALVVYILVRDLYLLLCNKFCNIL